jgi:probable phosphoglycerate mutase
MMLVVPLLLTLRCNTGIAYYYSYCYLTRWSRSCWYGASSRRSSNGGTAGTTALYADPVNPQLEKNEEGFVHQPNANLLSSISSLHHDYFVLRHGQSLANVQGLIQSDPVKAGTQYGLSETGRKQARKAANTVRQVFCQDDYKKYREIVILASDLLRAKETASLVCDEIRVANDDDDNRKENNGLPIYQDGVILEIRLRERWFGDWDGTTDDNYQKVWEQDAVDAGHQTMGVESVNSVMRRACECVLEWDERLTVKEHNKFNSNKPAMVILVAHGDVLQILQCAFAKIDGRRHRSLPHLETAQLRQLHLAS